MLCSELNQLFSEKKFRFLRLHRAILKLLMFERMMSWNHYFHENQHIKNLEVRGLKSSFARNCNLCFRFREFGFVKWKSTRRKCLHLLDVVSNFEILKYWQMKSDLCQRLLLWLRVFRRLSLLTNERSSMCKFSDWKRRTDCGSGLPAVSILQPVDVACLFGLGFNIVFAVSTLGTTLACKFHLVHLEYVSCCGKRKRASHPHSRGCFWGESAVSWFFESRHFMCIFWLKHERFLF